MLFWELTQTKIKFDFPFSYCTKSLLKTILVLHTIKIKAMVARVWYSDQQHWHHLGNLLEMKTSGVVAQW
jgi:hypothetical protein